MDPSEYNKFLRPIKYLVRTEKLTDYTAYDEDAFKGLASGEALQCRQLIDAHQFVIACRDCLGVKLDYSEESIAAIDLLVIPAILDASRYFSSLTKRPLAPSAASPISLTQVFSFFLLLRKELREACESLRHRNTSGQQYAALIDEQAMSSVIAMITEYIEAVCIDHHGGYWAAVPSVELDRVTGVILPDKREISFVDTVLLRFYSNSLPIGAAYQLYTGFDYSSALKRFPERLNMYFSNEK